MEYIIYNMRNRRFATGVGDIFKVWTGSFSFVASCVFHLLARLLICARLRCDVCSSNLLTAYILPLLLTYLRKTDFIWRGDWTILRKNRFASASLNTFVFYTCINLFYDTYIQNKYDIHIQNIFRKFVLVISVQYYNQ